MNSSVAYSHKGVPDATAMNRRHALRALGACVSLPFLESTKTLMGASRDPGRTPSSRMRLAYFYIPNGAPSGSWRPSEVGPQGELSRLNPSHAAFEPFKEELLILNNVWTPRGNGHVAGPPTWLTGSGYDDDRINAGGASVDQIAAAVVGKTTMLSSLQLSMRGEGYFSNSLPRNSLSWTDARTPASRLTSPRYVYDLLFRRSNEGFIDKSVLDLTMGQANRLKRNAPASDRHRIDAYLESVRSVERRIEFADQQARRMEAAGANLPFKIERPGLAIPDDHQEYMRLMMDLLALAFWSKATRVSTFMLDHGQSNRYFDFVDGVRGTWHALSHYKTISGKTEDDDGINSWNSVESKRAMYDRVVRWHHEQVAYFLGRLRDIDDEDGSLLDNSMIVYGSSLSDGHEHDEKDLPIMIAGRGAGSLRPGRGLYFDRATSFSKAHLSALLGMGVPAERFGETDREMSELLN